ncbi:MAG: energy transducer TonB [Planctomycetes bacterium]|nr:energy transducer TonB [Planctomycetota bacterium]
MTVAPLLREPETGVIPSRRIGKRRRTWASWPLSLMVHGTVAGLIAFVSALVPSPRPLCLAAPQVEETSSVRLRSEGATPEVSFEPRTPLSIPLEPPEVGRDEPEFIREAFHVPVEEKIVEPSFDEGVLDPLRILDRPFKSTQRLPEESSLSREGADSTVIPASPAQNPPPEYPLIARRRGLEGCVVLRVRVSEEGHPLEVQVQSSSGHRCLDEAAIRAVKNWRFTPAKRGNAAIPSLCEIPIRFRLEQSGPEEKKDPS